MAVFTESQFMVYLKEPHLKERIELLLSEPFNSLTVQSFKNRVSEKLRIPNEQLMLMYCGRVLKTGNTLQHYSIQNGVTIFYLKKKKITSTKSDNSGCGSNMETSSQLQRLIQNPRVHQILRRVLSEPLLLSSLTRGTPLENNPVIQNLASNSSLQFDSTDPQELVRLLQSDPSHSQGAEALLEQIGALVAGERGCTRSDVNDDDIVDMLEQSLDDEEGMEFNNEEEDESVGLAQEEMFQHSLAIHAHQQQQMEVVNNEATPPPLPARQNSNPGSTGITHNMLASALASLSSPNNSGQHSSLPSQLSPPSNLLSPPSPSYSGPRSLPSNSGNSAPPISHPTGVERSNSSPGSSLTQNDLQRALQSIERTRHQPQESTHRTEGRTTELSHQYHIQLQRLQAMGLTDEASCLHALEATRGDLDAALELLLGGM